jgi:hypothetical protein
MSVSQTMAAENVVLRYEKLTERSTSERNAKIRWSRPEKRV